jgi:hypothetical protein
MVRYFAEDDIASLAVKHDGGVVTRFHEACGEEKFRAAIERSTKTLDATYTRLSMWGSALAKEIGKGLDLATLRIS